MRRTTSDGLFGAAGLALAAAVALAATDFPERADAAVRYLYFLSLVLGLLSLLLVSQSLLRFRKETEKASSVEWVRAPLPFLGTLFAMLCYAWITPRLGFFPASFLFMLCLGWFLGFRKPLPLLGGTAGLLAFIWLIFVKFLAVPVPGGPWG
ncbi:tripartite tricarboxylate transporter TctB family protein [Aminiphilus circumscriptus]|jgi:peptidoglycan/LPS O-acetylase OafA/YrhL|uniref:tripartite tricarboxylate transporter TctB family protein n=1 Tax=Aminiphilus circumscriptus TaxID=290732 RepID=UPI0004786432|nr:tripartite tricarboxylate transporter TctB family protein [Aminiphilus circumscriptus]